MSAVDHDLAAPDGPGGVRERIEVVYGELSPLERTVADFVLEHLNELATYSGAELAKEAGASKATVSRFFRRLGFPSFAQARAQARAQASALRARGVPLGGLPPQAGNAVAAHLAQDQRNLAALARDVEHVRLERAAHLLAGARRVLLLGWRNSYPVALHLREQLLQARAAVDVGPHPGQTVAEELSALERRDALVVVAFRRRPPAVGRVLAAAREAEVPTVLLTDPTGRALGAQVEHRFTVPVDGPGAFDGYAAAMSLVTMLAEAVLARRGRAGRERIEQVGRVHARLGELE